MDITQRTATNVNLLMAKIHPQKGLVENVAPCSVHRCLRSAIADCSIRWEMGEILSWEKEEDFQVLGNDAQLTNVLINLLENSLQAIKTNGQGQIKISASSRDKTLHIIDTGGGIPEGNLDRIFDDFFSTKKSMGQGLAFCKSVMQELGGEITCTSQEGRFTQLSLRFP